MLPPPLFSLPLAFLGNFMGMDGLVVLIIGLLIFGSRLPEVGKNLGKTIVEFKKGLNSPGLSGTEEPQEPEAPTPAPRPQNRIAANTPRATTTKNLPTTEEV